MSSSSNTCAACGYPHLRSPQRSASGGASHEICPSCGFEPGYTDDDQEITPQQWGKQWAAAGKAWYSKGQPKPADWNPGASAKKAASKRTAVKAAKPKAKTPAKKAAKKAARRKK